MKFRHIVILLALALGISQARESQYRLDLSTDIPATATALFTSGFGTFLYNRMEIPDKVMDQGKLLPWDRPIAGRYSETADFMSDVGSILAVAPFAVGGFALYSGSSDWKEFGTFSYMLVQAALFQNGINLAFRSLELWPRPYIYAPSGKGEKQAQKARGEAYGSFFSGHASAAFTVAVFTSEWYSETQPNSSAKGIVRALAFSLAGLEGALRIAAGKHYLTDVVVGALVGTGVSYGVLYMHRNSNEKFSLWIGPAATGITLSF
ncbi:MAG: phosphatase PAP2 family protein [Fibrobacter sp.]|nr:phosphatase PAP2 family protein [Fibrobacter sp.]